MNKPLSLLLCLCGLITVPVTRAAAQDAPQKAEPIFKSYFVDAEEFTTLWRTVDADGDKYTWALDQLSFDPGTFSLKISTYQDIHEDLPEYFVTKQPLHLKKGKHNLSFYHVESGYPERFAVFLGTDDILENMENILERENVNRSFWVGDYVNFNITEEDYYYIAFAAYHENGKGYYLNIDAIEVDSGDFVGTPDLQVSLGLPSASCAFDDRQPLNIHVENVGTAAVKKIRAVYVVDESDTVKVDIPKRIEAADVADITLGNIDLSAEGVHKLYVRVEILENEGWAESYLKNNETTGEVRKWSPLESLPFETNFARTEDVENWDTENNDWTYYPKQGFVLARGEGALYSRCVPLQGEQPYRFSLNYLAGFLSNSGPVSEYFEILYGISGTNMSHWKKIAPGRNHYTEQMFIDKDYTFTPDADGIYSFAIRCPRGTNEYLAIKNITVSEVFEYDAALVEMGPLPLRVPAEQLLKDFVVPVKIRNMGSQTIDSVDVAFSLERKPVGEARFELGEAETVIAPTVTVQGTAVEETGSITIGHVVELSAEVSIPDREDGHPFDNALTHSLEVTDIELACDEATPAMCEGYNGVGGFELGSPLMLPSTDTLTGVRILWTRSDAFEITISIYHFNPATEELGEKIFYNVYRKPNSAGFYDYEIPALLLEAGYYLFSVQGKGYALIGDGSASGKTYIVEEGELEYQPGVGALSIRGLFEHNVVTLQRDIAVSEISYPVEEGYYSANQRIDALISNNGREDMQVSVSCSIDGTEVSEPQAFLIPGYGKQPVSFVGDLSVLGVHTVTIKAETENDEDTSNNVLSREFKSIGPEDPYLMDFEHCEDFTFDNFNPVWRTVDADGAPTCGLSSVTFPHQGEPFAFIAFNPEAVGAQYTNVVSFEGERLGMAFSAVGKANDDWLISPLLELPEDSAYIKLAVRSYNSKYGLEQYQILVSETGDMDDFDTVYADSAAARVWTDVTVPLDNYAGKKVYIAVRCVSNDVFIFMIDYIRVSKPEVIPVGNERAQAAGLKLYPNPAHNMITITAKDAAAAIRQVSVFDLSGRTIYASQNLGGRDSFRYNVSGLRPGLYLARVVTANGTTVMKFMVE